MDARWEELGRLIRNARANLGLSQEALAGYVGKKTTTVCRWENGTRRPKQGALLALSNVLAIKIQTLQRVAGYTPEFDWYASMAAQPGSEQDILLSVTDEEKEELRRYLHFLRFSQQLRSMRNTPSYKTHSR